MTAETLKPFITPQNVESFPTTQSSVTRSRHQRKINFLAIGLTTIVVIFLAAFLGYTIWLSGRVSSSEAEISRLNEVIDGMQKRLGLDHLDEYHDFEKKYTNALIDDPDSLDDIDEDYDDDDLDDAEKLHKADDDDEDDDDADEYERFDSYDEVQDLMKKFKNYDSDGDEEDDEDTDVATDQNREDNSNASEDDNLYVDFEKYKDSKKKKQSTRMARSISSHPPSEAPSQEVSKETPSNGLKEPEPLTTGLSRQPQSQEIAHKVTPHRRHFVSEQSERQRHSPLRPRSQRRRKIPQTKSGESLISAKQMNGVRSPFPDDFRPAAHFHLNRKVPERHAAIRVNSYPGDMYIGHHPSWSNEVGTEHFFSVENGVLTVREPGLYYVYAQICYNNTHDQNGYVIFHGQKPFLQCLNTVPTNIPLKIHTCHTSGLIYLSENDSIHIRDFHSDRNVILKDSNNRSYFGLIKV